LVGFYLGLVNNILIYSRRAREFFKGSALTLERRVIEMPTPYLGLYKGFNPGGLDAMTALILWIISALIAALLT